MYESPIKVEWNHRLAEEAEEAIRKLMNDEEAHIMYKVNLVVDVDRDELLKALQYDRHQYEKGYADRDAELVRCKDCKWFEDFKWCNDLGAMMKPDDFCSYAERRDDGSSTG